MPNRLVTGPVHQQVAWLAIQEKADFFNRVKAHAFDLALLEQRQVCLGDADVLCQLFRADFAACQHHVELNNYWHGLALDKIRIFFSQMKALRNDGGHQPHHARKKQRNHLVSAHANGDLPRTRRVVDGQQR